MTKNKKILIYTVVLLTAAPFLIIFNGYALTLFWEWFILPLFNVTNITLMQAIGLSFVVNYFILKKIKIEKTDYNKSLSELLSSILILFSKTGMALLLGWIISLFM